MERITARKNPLLQQVRKLISSRKERETSGLFVADGTKLLAEAVKWWPGLETVILSDGVEAQVPDHVRLVTVPKDVMESISPMQTPQGALFLCRLPEKTEFIPKPGMLLLDGIQDPGNLGTIIRIADWFGIENIYCSIGTADIYNPKTVQATMGAIGRVKVHYVDLPAFIASIKDNTAIYGTFLDGDNIYKKELKPTGLIIMGNEGNGISKECSKHVTERLLIPNYPAGRETSESLNVSVATAIICSEFRRRS